MTNTTESENRVLKASSCLSVSARNTISYELGIDQEGDAYLQFTGSTGTGIYSTEPISVNEIAVVLAKQLDGAPITSGIFKELLAGKSSNNAAMLVAVLRNENLLSGVEDSGSAYMVQDSAAFMAQIDTLKALPDGVTIQDTAAGSASGTLTLKTKPKKAA